MSANSDACAAATVAALPAYPYTSIDTWEAICAAQEPYWVSANALQSTDYLFGSSPDGWTLVNGTGSATITGGVCRLSSAAGTSPSLTTGPRCYRAHAYNPNHFTLTGRIAAFNQTGNSYNAYLDLIGSIRIQVLVTGAGTPYAVVNGSNVGNGNPGNVPLDGTGWLGVRLNGNFCEWYYGAGATLPSTFTLFHQQAITSFRYTSIGTGIRYASGALPATLTVDFDDLRLTQDQKLPGA